MRKREAIIVLISVVALLFWSATPAAPSHVTSAYQCTLDCTSGTQTLRCRHFCLASSSNCLCDCQVSSGGGGFCDGSCTDGEAPTSDFCTF